LRTPPLPSATRPHSADPAEAMGGGEAPPLVALAVRVAIAVEVAVRVAGAVLVPVDVDVRVAGVLLVEVAVDVGAPGERLGLFTPSQRP
jgi:hypothetical protein